VVLSRTTKGLAQGASISLSALLRALGPFVVSAVFSASYRILEFPLLIYISLALLYFVSSFLVIFVARILRTAGKEEMSSRHDGIELLSSDREQQEVIDVAPTLFEEPSRISNES